MEQFKSKIQKFKKQRKIIKYYNSWSSPLSEPLKRDIALYLTLNALVGECLHKDRAENQELDRQHNKIEKLKNRGKSLMAFAHEYGQETVQLWPLFPMKETRCALFPDIPIGLKEYVIVLIYYYLITNRGC